MLNKQNPYKFYTQIIVIKHIFVNHISSSKPHILNVYTELSNIQEGHKYMHALNTCTYPKFIQ